MSTGDQLITDSPHPRHTSPILASTIVFEENRSSRSPSRVRESSSCEPSFQDPNRYLSTCEPPSPCLSTQRSSQQYSLHQYPRNRSVQRSQLTRRHEVSRQQSPSPSPAQVNSRLQLIRRSHDSSREDSLNRSIPPTLHNRISSPRSSLRSQRAVSNRRDPSLSSGKICGEEIRCFHSNLLADRSPHNHQPRKKRHRHHRFKRHRHHRRSRSNEEVSLLQKRPQTDLHRDITQLRKTLMIFASRSNNNDMEEEPVMYDNKNLLEVPGLSSISFARNLLDNLFTVEEKAICVMPQSRIARRRGAVKAKFPMKSSTFADTWNQKIYPSLRQKLLDAKRKTKNNGITT
ncbi:unnamed protein product [Didymodactylos carnosus]|uniref:Uncharacterized protein n=1 Tax=Didymodactylos carnosus TaxID=1234261 RepID=A0A815X0I1_9BILA|nr:unnamed protein product [Didymodactylos carnosus]CAF4408526.1 unnamed protein product [Didymodactylos carnosus]